MTLNTKVLTADLPAGLARHSAEGSCPPAAAVALACLAAASSFFRLMARGVMVSRAWPDKCSVLAAGAEVEAADGASVEDAAAAGAVAAGCAVVVVVVVVVVPLSVEELVDGSMAAAAQGAAEL